MEVAGSETAFGEGDVVESEIGEITFLKRALHEGRLHEYACLSKMKLEREKRKGRIEGIEGIEKGGSFTLKDTLVNREVESRVWLRSVLPNLLSLNITLPAFMFLSFAWVMRPE